MEKEVVIQVNNLSKAYQLKDSSEPFWALKDISFSVNKGEILGIIGRNGAGKSTLLKILSDVIAPTSGEVIYSGRVSSILDIGTGFHPDLSGKDNIYLNASLLGVSKREIAEKLYEIIDFSGIGSFINEPVKNYSNGMYLRLAFSIAIHVDADLLLLDEVIAVGDSDFREKCYYKLRELPKKGRTILVVTHDMHHILEFCTRCLWLDKGIIKLQGNVLDVVESYFSSNILNLNNEFVHHGEIHTIINHNVKNLIKIIQCSILNSNNRNSKLYTHDPIKIVIECEKIDSISNIEIAICISNIEGIKLFIDSYALRPLTKTFSIHKKGKYEVMAYIPPDFLNRGIFTLSIIITSSFTKIHAFENIIVFKVFSIAQIESPDNYFNQMNTLIAPKLNWDVNLIQ